MLLFLFLGVVSGSCTFGVTGIDPLYDGDTTSLWAGACGYVLHFCPWNAPASVIWTIVEKSTGTVIQTMDPASTARGSITFCFSPGAPSQTTLSSARDYCVQTTVNQVTYSSALYYAKQVVLGITKPMTGSTIVAGTIIDLVYSFQANAPAQAIAGFSILLFPNNTIIGDPDRSFLDASEPPGIGYVQQIRISASQQPGEYYLVAGLLDLYKRDSLIRSSQTQTGLFHVVCPNPPCTNVPFPPAPPPVPVVIQTPAIQSPSPTSKANWIGLF
jgi:hypothetical protein